MATRYVWETTYGPVPDGLYVLHSCDNPPCVRPDHLMVGSLRANSIDAGRKGRLGTGKDATHCRRGHPFEGNTYIHPVTGRRSCHECIHLRDRSRSPRLRSKDLHWADPDEDGACRVCGERLHQAPAGPSGKLTWRHSRHHRRASDQWRRARRSGERANDRRAQ